MLLLAISFTFFQTLLNTFFLLAENKFFDQIYAFLITGIFSEKISNSDMTEQKIFFLNFFQKLEKNYDFPRKPKYSKIHTSVRSCNKKGDKLNFFSLLGSVFFTIPVSPGKKRRAKIETRSAGTYRLKILTLTKRQKTQIVLKFQEVATHFSPKN